MGGGGSNLAKCAVNSYVIQKMLTNIGLDTEVCMVKYMFIIIICVSLTINARVTICYGNNHYNRTHSQNFANNNELNINNSTVELSVSIMSGLVML